MLPVTVHTSISAPREDVFDLLCDLSLREAWMDHFITGLRLAHPDAKGQGAAIRFRLNAPRYKPWLQSQIADADRPRRVREEIAGGHGGRTHGEWTFELSRQGRDLTRVELTMWTEAGTPRERFLERLGARRWLRGQAKVALQRLRSYFEERPDAPLARATVAGWEPQKAPRFGVEPGPRPRPHAGPEQRASSG
jgi:uncharacterized protein YndB with AHSA1/START domain